MSQNEKTYEEKMAELNAPYLGGPRTSQGKANSSQNATKHGLCSTHIRFVNDHEPEIYKSIEATWFNSYQPKDPAETRLVKQLIDADFHLERAAKALADIEAHTYEHGGNPAHWSDDHHLKLARISRYHTSRNNAVIKARKAIDDYRRNRQNESIKSEKHEIYKEKNKPEPTLEEILQQLMEAKKKRDRMEQEQQSPPK